MEEQQKIVDGLLYPLWRMLSPETKKKRSKTIWDEFQTVMSVAANHGSLYAFLERFKKRFELQAKREQEEKILRYVQSQHDDDHEAVLETIRDHSFFLVILVRERNDQDKDAVSQDKVQDMLLEGLVTEEEVGELLEKNDNNWAKVFKALQKNNKK